VCLESWTSTQNKTLRKFQNWILRLQSIHAYAHANSTKQQAKTIKILKALLCESLKISAHSEIKITSSHIKQAIVCPNRTPAPVSSMLPDRFCTNVSALRIRFSPLKYKAKVINLPMTMSATKFDKCQVAATLSLIYTVRLGKTCCSQCVATRGYSPFPFSDVFCYVMESFKMYQDVIQHGEVDST